MSLFSSKSAGWGSNQQLSFLGKPQAFCKRAAEARSIHVRLWLSLRITELSARQIPNVNSSGRSFATLSKSYK